MLGEGLGGVVGLVEVEAVHVVDRLRHIELPAAGLTARLLGVVAAGGDEGRAVFVDDVDGDADDVSHAAQDGQVVRAASACRTVAGR